MALMQSETPRYDAYNNHSGTVNGQPAISKRTRVLIFRKITSFFLYRQGLEDIWDLCSNILGCSPDSIQNKIFHENDVVAAQTSKAETLATTAKIGIGIQARKEDRNLQAAEIMMRVGNLRQYCENMKAAGCWEKAISVAPAVSLDYWAALSQQYAKHLGSCSAEAAPHLAASGQIDTLVDYYLDRWELENAFIVSKVHSDGRFPPSRGGMMAAAGSDPSQGSRGSRGQLERIAGILGQRYRSQHQPVSSAASFLAVSNVQAAVDQLIIGHEHVLAYVVESLCAASINSNSLKALANSAERYQLFDLAADIWKMSPENVVQSGLLAARLQALGHPLPQNLHMEGRGYVLSSQASEIVQRVCSGEYEKAAVHAIDGLVAMFQSPDGWRVSDARELIEPLYSIRLDNVNVTVIAKVLACAAYVGFFDAMHFDLRDVVLPLAQTYKNIVTSQNLDLPMSIDELFLLEAIYRVNVDPQGAFASLDALAVQNQLPHHLMEVCKAHMQRVEKVIAKKAAQRVGQQKAPQRKGRTVLTGSNLPAGSAKSISRPSVLTNTQIRGPAFLLEDGRQYISLSEAVSWGMVNKFSPLNTGAVMTAM